MNNLNNITSKFLIEGTVSDIKPLGNGLINDPGRSQACLRKIRRRCGNDWPRHLRQALDFQGNS